LPWFSCLNSLTSHEISYRANIPALYNRGM